VDTKNAGGQSLLYLPLDKLMQLSSAQPGSAPANAPDTATTVRPPQDTSSSSTSSSDLTSRRDSLRSRDRETR
jgi:membrane protease subunit HflK